MIKITNANDSRIGLYRNLKNISVSLSDNKLLIAEGSITARKILNSDIEIVSIFALPEFLNLFAELITQKNISPDNLFTADKTLMNTIVGFRLHQGIMVLGKLPKETPLLELKPPIVVLNGIVNSENVGSIVRNAVAFGIKSIVFDKSSSHPFLRRAIRVSMGTAFSIEYYQSENLIKDLIELRNTKGLEIIASEISNNSIPVDLHKFKEQSTIIFGCEGKGISNDILSICNKVIYIPISKEVESLNVAATSAIIFNKLNHIKSQ